MDFYILHREEEFIYAMLFASIDWIKVNCPKIELALPAIAFLTKRLNRIPDGKLIGKNDDIIGGSIRLLLNHFDQESCSFLPHVKCGLGKG